MNRDKAIIESFKPFLPVVKDWIYNLIDVHFPVSKPVSEFGFSRLPSYYFKETLNSAKVVIVNKVPAIPLASFGLTQFGDFENMEAGGITYLDTYFIRSDHVHLEPTHFHELVHIIQWKHLGVDRFLLAYGLWLQKYGYRDNLFEKLAYTLENEFKGSIKPFNVESKIMPELDRMIANLF